MAHKSPFLPIKYSTQQSIMHKTPREQIHLFSRGYLLKGISRIRVRLSVQVLVRLPVPLRVRRAILNVCGRMNEISISKSVSNVQFFWAVTMTQDPMRPQISKRGHFRPSLCIKNDKRTYHFPPPVGLFYPIYFLCFCFVLFFFCFVF